MDKSSGLYRRIDRLFERAFVFNLNQILLDPGKARQIRRFLADLPFNSVLDVGCGPGNWARLAPGRYLGVDTSASFIAAARRRYAGDPAKQFVQADATTLEPGTPFDLAMLVSVLHHLSDAEAVRLLHGLAPRVRHLFVLDLYPVAWNPLSAWLYKMDRGHHIREPGAQATLLERENRFRIVKQGDYFCPNGLYRHTLFLLESRQLRGC